MIKQIKDIKNNDTFSVEAVVNRAEQLETKTGSPYVNMQVSDKTGAMSLKFWSTTLDDINYGKSVVGQAVKISGTASEYNGSIQASMNVNDIKLSQTNVLSLIAGVPDLSKLKSADDVIRQVLDYLFENDSEYFNLVKSILFNDKPNEIVSHTHEKVSFDTQPAAERIHHAFKGGLKYHTARMLKQAGHLVQVYPILNAPLLYTAILLHDAGKMLEYTSVEPTETTIDGALLGHIMIVDGWVVEYLAKNDKDLNNDKWRLLRHTILAHHGRLEWGSPVVAITPEAMIINEIDMIDAKIMQFETVYEQTPSGELSHDKFFGLNNKRLYHA